MALLQDSFPWGKICWKLCMLQSTTTAAERCFSTFTMVCHAVYKAVGSKIQSCLWRNNLMSSLHWLVLSSPIHSYFLVSAILNCLFRILISFLSHWFSISLLLPDFFWLTLSPLSMADNPSIYFLPFPQVPPKILNLLLSPILFSFTFGICNFNPFFAHTRLPTHSQISLFPCNIILFIIFNIYL